MFGFRISKILIDFVFVVGTHSYLPRYTYLPTPYIQSNCYNQRNSSDCVSHAIFNGKSSKLKASVPEKAIIHYPEASVWATHTFAGGRSAVSVNNCGKIVVAGDPRAAAIRQGDGTLAANILR